MDISAIKQSCQKGLRLVFNLPDGISIPQVDYKNIGQVQEFIKHIETKHACVVHVDIGRNSNLYTALLKRALCTDETILELLVSIKKIISLFKGSDSDSSDSDLVVVREHARLDDELGITSSSSETFMIPDELSHCMRVWVEKASSNTYVWESLSAYEDQASKIFQIRHWGIDKTRECSLWSDLVETFKCSDYARDIFGTGDEAEEYRLEIEAARKGLNTNANSYIAPLPDSLPNIKNQLQIVEGFFDISKKGLAVLFLAKIMFNPNCAQILKEAHFWDLIGRMFNWDDTSDRAILTYMMHYPIYILNYEDLAITRNVGLNSRTVFTMDQAAQFKQITKNVHLSPYTPHITGAQPLEETLPCFDKTATRRIYTQAEFDRNFKWATRDAFEGINLVEHKAAISGSLVLACAAYTSTQYTNAVRLDPPMENAIVTKQRKSGLTWDEYLASAEFKSIPDPSASCFLTYQEVEAAIERVRRQIESGISTGVYTEEEVKEEKKKKAAKVVKNNTQAQKKHGISKYDESSEEDIATSDDEQPSPPKTKVPPIKLARDIVVEMSQVKNSVDVDADDDWTKPIPCFIIRSNVAITFEQYTKSLQQAHQIIEKRIESVDQIISQEVKIDMDSITKDTFMRFLEVYYPGYASLLPGNFKIICTPPDKLGEYFKPRVSSLSDVDLSIHVETVEEFDRLAQSIYTKIKINCEKYGPVWMQRVPSWNGKYRIYGPGLIRDIDIFMKRGTTPLQLVKAYHLDAVKMYYDGKMTYLLISCITALLSGICRNYKWHPAGKPPGHIISRYLERSYTVPLNANERPPLHEYFKVTPVLLPISVAHPNMAVWGPVNSAHPLFNTYAYGCGIRDGLVQLKVPTTLKFVDAGQYFQPTYSFKEFGQDLTRNNPDNPLKIQAPSMRCVAAYVKHMNFDT